MSHYDAPLREMKFVINELAGLDAIASLPGRDDASADTVDAILAEAGRFAREVLAPINQAGFRRGPVLSCPAPIESTHLQAR